MGLGYYNHVGQINDWTDSCAWSAKESSLLDGIVKGGALCCCSAVWADHLAIGKYNTQRWN